MRELTPDIIKTLTPDQIELLIELGDLARKEEELTGQIDDIRRQEEKVGLARNNHLNRAVHEDSSFVDLLSVRAVREREHHPREACRDFASAHPCRPGRPGDCSPPGSQLRDQDRGLKESGWHAFPVADGISMLMASYDAKSMAPKHPRSVRS